MADDAKQDTKAGTKPADTKGAEGNTAVPHQGDHDRVQMLSLRADGTPDQHNPEIIGDPEHAKALAREQFAQQAVSAADVRGHSVPMMVVGDELKPASEAPQDPSIAEAQAEHQKLEEAAHKAADAMVDSLSKQDDKAKDTDAK
jgi:hypothetical protein